MNKAEQKEKGIKFPPLFTKDEDNDKMTNTNKVVTQSAGQTNTTSTEATTKDDLAPISMEEYENENQLRDLKKAMEFDAQIAVEEGLEK